MPPARRAAPSPGELPLSVLVLLAAIAALAAGGFVLARGRALAAADGGARLHSLPGYYGWYGALWSALPGIAVTALWLAAAPSLLPSLALAPGAAAPEDPAQRELFWNDVENFARGNFAAEIAGDAVRSTAERYVALRERALTGAFALTMLLGLAGGVVRAAPASGPRSRRAFTSSDSCAASCSLSSTLAILVTIGIVLSLVFETAALLRLGGAERVPVRNRSGVRRPRCAPTRSRARGRSAPFRCSSARS